MEGNLPDLEDAPPNSRARVTFSELSVPRRVGIVVLGAIQLTLLIAAQRDLQRRPADQVNGPKSIWRLVCLLNFVGPLSYFRWGRRTGSADV